MKAKPFKHLINPTGTNNGFNNKFIIADDHKPP